MVEVVLVAEGNSVEVLRASRELAVCDWIGVSRVLVAKMVTTHVWGAVGSTS